MGITTEDFEHRLAQEGELVWQCWSQIICCHWQIIWEQRLTTSPLLLLPCFIGSTLIRVVVLYRLLIECVEQEGHSNGEANIEEQDDSTLNRCEYTVWLISGPCNDDQDCRDALHCSMRVVNHILQPDVIHLHSYLIVHNYKYDPPNDWDQPLHQVSNPHEKPATPVHWVQLKRSYLIGSEWHSPGQPEHNWCECWETADDTHIEVGFLIVDKWVCCWVAAVFQLRVAQWIIRELKIGGILSWINHVGEEWESAFNEWLLL